MHCAVCCGRRRAVARYRICGHSRTDGALPAQCAAGPGLADHPASIENTQSQTHVAVVRPPRLSATTVEANASGGSATASSSARRAPAVSRRPLPQPRGPPPTASRQRLTSRASARDRGEVARRASMGTLPVPKNEAGLRELHRSRPQSAQGGSSSWGGVGAPYLLGDPHPLAGRDACGTQARKGQLELASPRGCTGAGSILDVASCVLSQPSRRGRFVVLRRDPRPWGKRWGGTRFTVSLHVKIVLYMYLCTPEFRNACRLSAIPVTSAINEGYPLEGSASRIAADPCIWALLVNVILCSARRLVRWQDSSGLVMKVNTCYIVMGLDAPKGFRRVLQDCAEALRANPISEAVYLGVHSGPHSPDHRWGTLHRKIASHPSSIGSARTPTRLSG